MNTQGDPDRLPPPLGAGRGGGQREAASPPPKPSPLAALNAHIAQASQAAAGVPRSSAGQWPELRSAQRFRETWERLGAEEAVVKATHRAPENAGPLNSHMLVLRTLGLMRELSPHYLRRFLSHTETLLWLEQAQGQLKAPAGKGKVVKAARPKK
ncbi:DUF2894 domain-containing protein [Hydrogenophaga sp. ZJX-1]|uniref:DUF2894 domain-containing protein n=1 Tax=Hydrogenophaga sp. ZJX-1 TaxID=3404778 RepID=UPI003B285A0E